MLNTGWEKLALALLTEGQLEEVLEGQAGTPKRAVSGAGGGATSLSVYPASLAKVQGDRIIMVEEGLERKLLVVGGGELYAKLAGEECGSSEAQCKICPLTHDNRLVLNSFFPYTLPQAIGTQMATIGLGDRLGLASGGHLEALAGREIRPILAQQSIRELTLTGRTYEQVLDAAAFAVFEKGYKDGWGADGDHLKTPDDIAYALRLGFSMLTLDASDHIANDVAALDDAAVAERYAQELPAAERARLEAAYADKSFAIEGASIAIGLADLKRYALVYGKALAFMVRIYEEQIVTAGRAIDFEISIDETATPTEPAAHWFVASELKQAGVEVYSIAPRFCGEFQKGIDYIGDLAQFEQELAIHAAICDHFGYKLSVHSGSDKFSVFPLVARYTGGRFHLKTAGTNWLEAVRTVARYNPELYRSMHAYAAAHVEEALQYYHITADFNTIAPLEETADEALPAYMDQDAARQLLHITYGLLLTARDEAGQPLFKETFYAFLKAHAAQYEEALVAHIGKHLDLLGK